MALSNIDVVRLKSSDKSTITREVTRGDGVASFFKLNHAPIISSVPPEVRVDSNLKTVGADYTVDYSNGIITFIVSPAMNTTIDFVYYWSIFGDEEVQYFIDEAGGNLTVAAARLLLANAADAAKLAKRQTLSGGGGSGSATTDTSVVARELRATADALIKMEKELGESIPAEGITEVPWTEANYGKQVEQHMIRNEL